jgi:hypothetical protein
VLEDRVKWIKKFQSYSKIIQVIGMINSLTNHYYQHIFANSNRINDIPDVEKLTELAYLKELELSGNALSRRPGYR